VAAAAYGLFVGVVVYRTITWRMLYQIFAEAAEISAVVMIIISLATLFAYAGSTLGAFDAFAKLLLNAAGSEFWVLLLITVILLIAGMVLDAISIFFVFLPILLPIMQAYHWDAVWFGVVMTMHLSIGQFTPPMAVNLIVTTRIAGVTMESTVPWVIWMVLAMLLSVFVVMGVPQIATWLPHLLGYL
jgi:TRAP-type C4-dicarboxylate transport system permease large subunit